MSEASARCTSIESSGVRFTWSPSISERNSALFRDLAQFRQAEHLEPAGVGEDGTLPVHEPVQPAVRTDHFDAGTQHQVEGVAEDDLCAE
jgi:hypothetical protein